MSFYLFILLTSFVINFSLIIPFINLLYKLKFQRAHQVTRDAFDNKTPIFDRFNHAKAGKPVGGGMLIILTTVIVFTIFMLIGVMMGVKTTSNYPAIGSEIKILLFTFCSFGFLGLYDDLKKIFFWKDEVFFGLRLRHKLIIEIILAGIISFWIFNDLKIDIINIPYLGVFNVSWFYMLFSTFVIVSFANAVNITDGLDGLASGVLMIALFALWFIAGSMFDTVVATFIAVWIGGIIAFLYFNIYPARLFLGDTGALAFGATFAVIGLILGRPFALPIIGLFFVVEIVTSLAQLLAKRFLHRKILLVSPFHLLLQLKGWEEPKIVMRVWIVSVLFAVIGLMIAFMK